MATQPEYDLNAFELKLRYGNQRENEFAKLLFRPDIEVKSEPKALKTGNVFVEFQQGIPPRASGIATSKAHWYAFELPGVCWILTERPRLLEIAREIRDDRGATPGGDNNNKGVLVPTVRLIGAT